MRALAVVNLKGGNDLAWTGLDIHQHHVPAIFIVRDHAHRRNTERCFLCALNLTHFCTVFGIETGELPAAGTENPPFIKSSALKMIVAGLVFPDNLRIVPADLNHLGAMTVSGGDKYLVFTH